MVARGLLVTGGQAITRKLPGNRRPGNNPQKTVEGQPRNNPNTATGGRRGNHPQTARRVALAITREARKGAAGMTQEFVAESTQSITLENSRNECARGKCGTHSPPARGCGRRRR